MPPIDTSFKEYNCFDAALHFAGSIDGGMTRNMIFHDDFGWRLEK